MALVRLNIRLRTVAAIPVAAAVISMLLRKRFIANNFIPPDLNAAQNKARLSEAIINADVIAVNGTSVEMGEAGKNNEISAEAMLARKMLPATNSSAHGPASCLFHPPRVSPRNPNIFRVIALALVWPARNRLAVVMLL